MQPTCNPTLELYKAGRDPLVFICHHTIQFTKDTGRRVLRQVGGLNLPNRCLLRSVSPSGSLSCTSTDSSTTVAYSSVDCRLDFVDTKVGAVEVGSTAVGARGRSVSTRSKPHIRPSSLPVHRHGTSLLDLLHYLYRLSAPHLHTNTPKRHVAHTLTLGLVSNSTEA
jgi:hypothetical protein